MNREEQERLDFEKKSEELTMKMFDKLRPHMANEHNPRYVAAVKGTPFENATQQDRNDVERKVKGLYVQKYKEFRDAWFNLFGDANVRPFKNGAKHYLDKFLNESMRHPESFNLKNHAEKWLKVQYMDEYNLKRKR